MLDNEALCDRVCEAERLIDSLGEALCELVVVRDGVCVSVKDCVAVWL